ncbi:MAG: acyl transferase [Bacteroidia bacterium]
MFNPEKFRTKIFSSSINFEEAALKLFRFQAEHVEIYKQYISLLKIEPFKINSINEIPFLPISFFKTHKIISDQLFGIGTEEKIASFLAMTESGKPETIFTSSGTTGSATSKHYVADIRWYEESFTKGFKHFYGNIDEYCILALLPSYLERTGSSLVYMTDYLIRKSNHLDSGFYLNEMNVLIEKIKSLQEQKQKTILLGVTYALLDLAEQINFSSINNNWEFIIMETGGMKGKRKEMIREEVHEILCHAFDVKTIHSEYGMTELLSQAYSKGNGIFQTPPWMQILIRDINDSKNIIANNQTGGINIIDLANVYSCAFIATQDLGRKYNDNSFEVLGRFDDSDLRGCNLMVQ